MGKGLNMIMGLWLCVFYVLGAIVFDFWSQERFPEADDDAAVCGAVAWPISLAIWWGLKARQAFAT
jgi:hypothetical protein